MSETKISTSTKRTVSNGISLERGAEQFLTFHAPGTIHREWKRAQEGPGSGAFPPLESDRTAFQFQRTRAVTLPWADIVQPGVSDLASDFVFLRAALERAWGCRPSDTDSSVLKDYVFFCNESEFEYCITNADRLLPSEASCLDYQWIAVPGGGLVVRVKQDFFFLRAKPDNNTLKVFDDKGSLLTNWVADIECTSVARPSPSTGALLDPNLVQRRSGGAEPLVGPIVSTPPAETICDELRQTLEWKGPAGCEFYAISGPTSATPPIQPTGNHSTQPFVTGPTQAQIDRVNSLPGNTPSVWPIYDASGNIDVPAKELVLIYGRKASNNVRFYWARFRDRYTVPGRFSDANDYEAFWEAMTSLRQVFPKSLSDEDLVRALPQGYDLAVDESAIVEEFGQLDAEKAIYQIALGGDPPKIDLGDPFDPMFESKIARLTVFQRRVARLKVQIDRLRARASEMGLYLAVEDEPNVDALQQQMKTAEVPQPQIDAAIKGIAAFKKGRLYRFGGLANVAWTTQETFNVPRQVSNHNNGVFGIGGSDSSSWVTVQETRTVPHSFSYQTLAEVFPDAQPWLKERAKLENRGWKCHIFQLSDDGFVSQYGETIENLLVLCDSSESFRSACAIFYPVYEESLTRGEPILAKYKIIKAPIPGWTTIHAPQVFIEETLDYRINWLGSEIGDLAASTNLAPGETKSVTVTRSFSVSLEQSRSETDVQDTTSARSSDIATMIENEAKSSTNLSASNGFNAKVSGTYKGVTGEMGLDNKSDMSADSFSRYFQSLAKKATENFSHSAHQEVTFTSTSTTKSEVSETTTTQVTNINQGKTLNLLFYRVANVFEGSLHFRRIRLTIIDGRELIQGYGLTSSRTFDFDDAEPALSYLASDNAFNAMFGINPFRLKMAAAEAILETVKKEYEDGQNGEGDSLASDRSICCLKSDARVDRLIDCQTDDALRLDAIVNAKFSDLRLSETQLKNEPLVRDLFYLPSGAMYLDSLVGISKGTEEYAERMRNEEVLAKAAKVRKKMSDALLNESRARMIKGLTRYKRLRRPYIRSVQAIQNSGELRIILSSAIPDGNWVVEQDGVPVPTESTVVSDNSIDVSLPPGTDLNMQTRAVAVAFRLVEYDQGLVISRRKPLFDWL
jgi:hypothetical protein